MLKKATVLTRPAPARRDAPFRGQGRSSETDPRFTFHASRFTVLWSDTRTPLADFFSILLVGARCNHLGTYRRWAFAEFTEIYQIEADFKAKIQSEFNKMMTGLQARRID